MRLMSFINRLRHDNSGVALIEFAYSMPIFLGIGIAGLEITNMAITRMEVSQIALGVADNSARLGQNDNAAVAPTIREADVDTLLSGTMIQADRINFEQNGRIILSSLEFDPVSQRQFIHWQRCAGELDRDSKYGDDENNNGLGTQELAGMGANTITADEDNAIMFVEVYYDYEGIFGDYFTDGVSFNREAAFIVRDDRNLRDSDEVGLTGGASDSSCD